ncbi:MAG TPA: 50S ribosomal protein L1 [Planctomycetaceae bacterium]|nr:50S ribosomal protein L1 [Planctomycetaceae bacterium]
MPRQSKRMKHLAEKTRTLGVLDLGSAVKSLKTLGDDLPKSVKPIRFDQTVEIALRLGVDPKQADQLVRGSIVLPHGIGKSQRVIVFAQGENVAVAEAAGADAIGGKELAEKIKEGWLEFDVAIATPDMMGVVGPLGKVLGPRGLMPSPRAGTVTQDIASAIADYKAGKVEFRVDAGGNVHCVVGKLSFSEQQLLENIQALVNYIQSLKPSSSKGVFMRGVTITATMMPGIAVAI